jgi:hypothetical protein
LRLAREIALKTGDPMISDLISYGLLAAIFVVTGLRTFFDKPNKTTEIPLQHWRKNLVGRENQ